MNTANEFLRIEIEKTPQMASVGVGRETALIVSPQRQAASANAADECVSERDESISTEFDSFAEICRRYVCREKTWTWNSHLA